MKFRNKITLTIIAVTIIFMMSFGIMFYKGASEEIRGDAIEFLEKGMDLASDQFTRVLLEKIKGIEIVASQPHIIEALGDRNSFLSRFSREERDEYLSALNDRWMESSEESEFVRGYLDNEISAYLRSLMTRPEYGEIFLTNRYGELVASTGKLTTLAHAHKYWWRGAFAEGSGRVFIDDRGYDDSVGGYVLGIVVPVKEAGEVIGILKFNINIISFLDTLLGYGRIMGDEWDVSIVRSGGRVVLNAYDGPLSVTYDHRVMEQVENRTTAFSLEDRETGEQFMYVSSPIQSTIAHGEFDFGGSPESIDHTSGNRGEYWLLVAAVSRTELFREVNKNLLTIIEVSLILLIFLVVSAYILSRQLTQNIGKIITAGREIGEGNLDVQLCVNSRDEIGDLAGVINRMVLNLQGTMVARDRLIDSQKQLKKSLDEKEFLLKELNHRVKNNLAMITSLLRMKDADEAADLSDIILRVEAVSSVYELLYRQDDPSRVVLRDYIQDVLQNVFASTAGREVRTQYTIPEVSVQSDAAIPLGLIINEVATNAVKHGFNSIENPVFTVTMKEEPGKSGYVVSMSNNGAPVPEDVLLDNPQTLGLRLITALTDQLGGAIELIRSPHPEFIIRFPKDDSRVDKV